MAQCNHSKRKTDVEFCALQRTFRIVCDCNCLSTGILATGPIRIFLYRTVYALANMWATGGTAVFLHDTFNVHTEQHNCAQSFRQSESTINACTHLSRDPSVSSSQYLLVWSLERERESGKNMQDYLAKWKQEKK